jgi:hypothetical protein
MSLSQETSGPAPKPIAERQAVIEAIHAEIFGPQSKSRNTEARNYDEHYTAAQIEDALGHVNGVDDRERWLRMGMAVKSYFGDGGRPLWDSWSRRSEKFDETDQDRTWRSIKAACPGGVSIATLIQSAREGGWTGPRQAQSNGASEHKAAAPSPSREAKFRRDYREELAVTERLLALHRENLLWARGLDYFVWDGLRWRHDEMEEVYGLAKQVVQSLYDEANALDFESEEHKQLYRLACSVSKRGRIEGAIRNARSDVAVSADALDSQPYLLNVRNGTVDLRTGALRPHARADRITKLIPIDYLPAAKCQKWEMFLDDIFAGDGELIKYIQTALGYSITADQKEKAFWFLWGPKDTGKTTLFAVVRDIVSDYAQTVPKSVFLKQDGDKIRSDIARLRGVRFACALRHRSIQASMRTHSRC